VSTVPFVTGEVSNVVSLVHSGFNPVHPSTSEDNSMRKIQIVVVKIDEKAKTMRWYSQEYGNGENKINNHFSI
jgi:hypothetical protein